MQLNDTSFWLSRPLQEVINHTAETLDMHGFDAAQEAVNSMLTCLCMNSDDSDASAVIHENAARVVRYACALHSNMCGVLLQHLVAIPRPVSFVSILPSILSRAPAQIINDAFDVLLTIALRNEYLVRVMNALFEIELSTSQKAKVVELTMNALSVISEDDFPSIFKVVFMNLNAFVGTKVIGKIRAEVRKAILHLKIVSIINRAGGMLFDRLSYRAYD
jgi:hypothetical protein